MMQHPGGWQRCTEEPGIAMHDVITVSSGHQIEKGNDIIWMFI